MTYIVRLTAVLLLAGSTLPVAADCIRTSSIRGYEPLDKQNLILRANAGRPYHVELRGFCFGLQYTNVIAYADPDRDRRLCPGGLDAIVIRDPKPESCRIGSITELNESQLAELRARFGKTDIVEGEVEETMPDELPPEDESADPADAGGADNDQDDQ